MYSLFQGVIFWKPNKLHINMNCHGCYFQIINVFCTHRLARIKAEAKRRREERDRLERVKQEERDRREARFMKQFQEWHVQPDGRVELSLV